jgi:phosphatidylglycerophosphate synthase
MNMFTWMVFAAVALTLLSLATGILAMLKDGEVGHYESAHWMNWRVGFQALAAAMVLMAMNAPQ